MILICIHFTTLITSVLDGNEKLEFTTITVIISTVILEDKPLPIVLWFVFQVKTVTVSHRTRPLQKKLLKSYSASIVLIGMDQSHIKRQLLENLNLTNSYAASNV